MTEKTVVCLCRHTEVSEKNVCGVCLYVCVHVGDAHYEVFLTDQMMNKNKIPDWR